MTLPCGEINDFAANQCKNETLLCREAIKLFDKSEYIALIGSRADISRTDTMNLSPF